MDQENQINQNIFFNKRNGKYIEIGAGSTGNATDFFEKQLGWTGILVEPNPVSYKKLQEYRPNSIIHTCPVSIYPEVFFHSYYGDSADMSAIENTVNDDIGVVYYNDEIIINEKKTIDLLETKTLTDIIHEPYDFMVMDTNGHELEVLESWNFSQPIGFILFYTKTMDESRLLVCETILKYRNYVFVDKVLINHQMFDVWKKENKETCQIM
jgi:hypothetical protein